MGQKKSGVYRSLIQRQNAAVAAGFHFEACWFAHAIFEDRTRSIVKNSGDGNGYGGSIAEKLKLIAKRYDASVAKLINGRPVKKNGKKQKVPKYPHLHTLKKSEILIVQRWTRLRNELAHDLASGKISLAETDTRSRKLSLVGERRVRDMCAAAMRIKKRNLSKKRKPAK